MSRMGRGVDPCAQWGHDWENVIFQELVFDDALMRSVEKQVFLCRCRECGEWRDE